MLVMALPVTLLLGQLSLWYEARPLRVGEDSVITLKLGGDQRSSLAGREPRALAALWMCPPDRYALRSKREVCWSVKAREPGSHLLAFRVDDRTVTKELAVGDGFMRVSAERPAWGDVSSIFMNPWEEPFRPGEPVRSIAIEYPERSSWTSGTGLLADLLVRRLDGGRVVLASRAGCQGLMPMSSIAPRSNVPSSSHAGGQ